MGTASAKQPAERYLAIYINDHRAGATAGLSLARRAQRENSGTPFGEALAVVVAAIEEDRMQLERVAQALGVRADPLKIGLARTGELLGRLKTNGQLRGYSPLSRLLELESLLAGIDAKRSLWRALDAAQRPELAGIDFGALVERATQQREHLLPYHRKAAQLAFGAASEPESQSDAAQNAAQNAAPASAPS